MLLLQIQSQRFALIGLLAACLELAGCGPSYERTEHYRTREDAVRVGAFNRGWLPEWLPASSRDIWETHDQDSNHLYVKFAFNNTERDGLLKAANAVPMAAKEKPKLPTISEEWWPKNLSLTHCYRVEHGEGTSVLVLDETTSTAVLWNTR
jgi:hypothetical protein